MGDQNFLDQFISLYDNKTTINICSTGSPVRKKKPLQLRFPVIITILLVQASCLIILLTKCILSFVKIYGK